MRYTGTLGESVEGRGAICVEGEASHNTRELCVDPREGVMKC